MHVRELERPAPRTPRRRRGARRAPGWRAPRWRRLGAGKTCLVRASPAASARTTRPCTARRSRSYRVPRRTPAAQHVDLYRLSARATMSYCSATCSTARVAAVEWFDRLPRRGDEYLWYGSASGTVTAGTATFRLEARGPRHVRWLEAALAPMTRRWRSGPEVRRHVVADLERIVTSAGRIAHARRRASGGVVGRRWRARRTGPRLARGAARGRQRECDALVASGGGDGDAQALVLQDLDALRGRSSATRCASRPTAPTARPGSSGRRERLTGALDAGQVAVVAVPGLRRAWDSPLGDGGSDTSAVAWRRAARRRLRDLHRRRRGLHQRPTIVPHAASSTHRLRRDARAGEPRRQVLQIRSVEFASVPGAVHVARRSTTARATW